jgi:hypothetical protein
MQKKLLVAALFSISATGVMAQTNSAANPFEGPSVGVNVSSVGGSTDLSGSTSANMGQQSVVPAVEAGSAATVGAGSTITGRLLAKTAITMDSDTITKPAR